MHIWLNNWSFVSYYNISPFRFSNLHANVFLFLPTYISLFWRDSPQWARASSFTKFLNHTQRRTTVTRTPLGEWSACRRDLYLTTHNAHNRPTSIHPVGFEPTISAGERPQTYALDRAATGTGFLTYTSSEIYNSCSTFFSSRISVKLLSTYKLPSRSYLTTFLFILNVPHFLITNAYRPFPIYAADIFIATSVIRSFRSVTKIRTYKTSSSLSRKFTSEMRKHLILKNTSENKSAI